MRIQLSRTITGALFLVIIQIENTSRRLSTQEIGSEFNRISTKITREVLCIFIILSSAYIYVHEDI